MLDWQNLSFNALWIFALALSLGIFSWNWWESRENNVSLSRTLSILNRRRALYATGLLFCVGLAGASLGSLDAVPYTVIWTVLAVAFLGLMIFEK